MIKKKTLLMIFIPLIIIAGCNKINKPLDFDYGHVENNKYINSFFKAEMTIPKSWVVQSKEQMENLTETGKDLVAGDDANMKAKLNASEINIANLLSVNQFEQGAAVEYNPSILLIAENIKNSPGVKTGKDYLFHTKKFLEQSQLKYDHLDSQFEREVINGVDFYKLNADITYGGVTIKQVYYSTILKNFSFNAIISFTNDEQKAELLGSLTSLKFKN
jgi:hypothetical protein